MSLERAPKFTGRVERGKVHLDAPDTYSRYVACMEGAKVNVAVSRYRAIRSLPQNKYYWSVVLPIFGEHCGYDKCEMHQALKLRFLRINDDSSLPSARSTARLNTKEFGEYLDDCIRLAAEMGVVIPAPGECE